MRVTKKLVATTCLPIYQKVLEEGKKDNFNRFRRRLGAYNARFGICSLFYVHTEYHCCKLFEKHTSKNSWGFGKGVFLCKIPYYANSKKEAVELIRKRIKFLEQWNK